MKFECCLLVFVLASGVMTQILKYDFERDPIPGIISPQKSLTLDDSIFKKGSKSLKWQWSSGDRLRWNIASENIGVSGGIKIWIYNPVPISQKCLFICVKQIRRRRRRTVSCFPFSLDFNGWRAAWVSYKEFLGCSLSSTRSSPRKAKNQQIREFFLVAPSNVKSPSPLYIDFLQFPTQMSLATRDSIVPPLTYEESGQTYCTSCSKVHSKLSEEAALSKHPRRRFWQQIYRWSVKTPSPPAAAKVDTNKLTSIKTITERLVNWYAGKETTFTRIPHNVSPTDKFVEHRWNSLLKTFDDAHSKLKSFTRGGSDKPTTGLFSRNDQSKKRGGNEEFSYVHHKVLLPLTLEYYIRSRKIEVQQAACEFATEYQCLAQNTPSEADIKAITGKDSAIKKKFKASYNALPTSSSSNMHGSCSTVKDFCFEHVKKALESINEIRKKKIIAVFTYLKDQGLAGGSGLGSMDHELLQMSGYFHSIFLMRNELGSDIIDAMKWYSEFGEVYQTKFEYQGTTADRARSAMLYRLMTVLSMPENSDTEKSEKIRDMDALKNWIENALSISEGLSGLIKPDYTCYHHKTFYASAYCPPALHTAAFVSYLLEGTDYSLNSEIKTNIINTLKVLRIAAVYYSTPSQVGGRFPKYNKAILAEHVPAFAYMAIDDSAGPEDDTLLPDLDEVRMFLRLYKPVQGGCKAGLLNSQLCKGTTSRIYYLNTLGSLEIMERVKNLTIEKTGEWHYTAEPSQSGHWTKQFAALSIHRRDDWAVTVKGLDKYVWDFESGGDNIYGMYGSHGAMLIANSEAALNSKDVEKGWDWRKIPGTTVVNVPYSAMSDISKSSSRHYNPSNDAMAGGVFFKGSQFRTKRNGVFGMNFKKPPYKLKSGPFHNVDFSFRKSVFFYDDIVVSIGSNIEYSGGQYEVHTTLFQDLMQQQPASSKASTTPSNIFRCNEGGSSQTNQPKTDWSRMALAILVDVNGNRYYIPNPDKQGLVLSRNIMQQSPRPKESDPQVKTSGIYCTAWFNHGTNPNGATSKYEYAVQIDAETSSRSNKGQLDPQMRYTVIKREDDVHVVKFKEHSNRGAVYGYVVFPPTPTAAVDVGNEGPIQSVLHQSIIMAEEITKKKLFISVQSPQLKLQERSGSPSWCDEGTTSPSESNDVHEILLFCSKSTSQSVHVNLRNNAKWSSLTSLSVGGKDKLNEKSDFLDPAGAPNTNPIKFVNLRNGAETEVAFEYSNMEKNV